VDRDIFQRRLTSATVTFYWTIVFVHVMAVVIAFGPIFAYPILWRAARNRFPRSLPFVLRTQDRIGKTVIGPGSVLVLITGVYLVLSTAPQAAYDFDAKFVQVALPILVALILMGPLYFGRTEGRLADLAERDIGASTGGEVTLSEEFDRGIRQLTLISRLASIAVLVALFFMVVKP
jgi:uncharacterized membrane protein